MEKIVYTNAAGASVTLDHTGTYFLHGFTGFTAAEVIPAVSSGYGQHGVSWYGNRLGIRMMTLTIGVHGDVHGYTRILNQIFNPLQGTGQLVYTNDAGSRMIPVVVTGPPEVSERRGYLYLITVELTAYDPFFRDVAELALSMTDFAGGLKFPFNTSTRQHMQFAQQGALARINNIGDYPAPIRAEFRGPAVNPVLTLVDTGEFIKVSTTIAAGEKLWINTAYGNKTVLHELADGSMMSANNLITLDSTFLQLPTGESMMTFSTDGGEPSVYLYWRNLYMGV